MKKIILTLFSFQFSLFTSFAQPATGTCPSDKTHKWGIGARINTIEVREPLAGITIGQKYFDGGDLKVKSYSFCIVNNYFINEKIALRLKYGITRRYNIEHRNIKTSLESPRGISHHELKQNTINISSGCKWYIIKEHKYNLYFGFEIPFSAKSKTTDSLWVIEKDPIYDTISYESHHLTTIPGGISIGVGAFAGFNLNVFKNLSFGAESSFAFLYTKMGGEIIIESTYIFPVYIYTTFKYNDTAEHLKISPIISSLTVSFWF